jgi:hypothetical protein
MRTRPLLASPALWIGAVATAAALAFGCGSSSSGTPEPTGPTKDGGCQGAACVDAGPGADTGSSNPDAGEGPDVHEADGSRDGAAADALYGCAATGSFGWRCSASTTGPDPTDCTDPIYPDCFVGGQGSWCTKACPGGAADCTMAAEDAGCAPTACNARGYCK